MRLKTVLIPAASFFEWRHIVKKGIEHVSNALSGDASDTHARYLEVIISGVRFVDIYLPNGNPVGTEKFEYKLAWIERLLVKMSQWKADGVPTVIGDDFNVIPEDLDCHKPDHWARQRTSQRLLRALCHGNNEVSEILQRRNAIMGFLFDGWPV